MLSINTNLSSLIAQGSMKSSTNKFNQAIERMTTGFKINHANDNAANYAISTNMTTKIGAYNVAEDNAAMGLDLISTAEGTLSQIEDKLQRLRALAEQASNGTYGEQSLNAINAEANALVDEIERIYNNTEYNGINLMKGRVVGTEESKFIKDIDRRDTSKMTTLASVDETQKLEYGTYSISTAEELAKLATMTNNGLIGADTEFVLANDIDLSGYSNWTPIGISLGTGIDVGRFNAKFDGNGFIITGLKINAVDKAHVGLFGFCMGTVENLAIENADVVGANNSGILAGTAAHVQNCYVTGTLKGHNNTGGLVGWLTFALDSYSEAIVSNSNQNVGGFAGSIAGFVENCYAIGEVSGKDKVGGFVGNLSYLAEPIVKNCFATGIAIASNGSCGEFVGVDSYLQYVSLIAIAGSIANDATIFSRNSLSDLQIGINSLSSSLVSVDTGYLLNGLSILRRIGSGTGDYLTMLDKMLAQVSEKQTHFGATSNRLESVLEEITIQRDNLVSSRSTIRDADIAEVSSHYIQQQILQQASATLLATANQSPAIALQLI